MNTVERYDPEKDNWEELACLNRARSGAGKFGFIYLLCIYKIHVFYTRL
ncbi:unnamed protein product [Schistosoma mattheei]|uniref:Uncharacterized protein n=1 Tax=Schistosoma mattheei TaxID=31246 RepID=A0A3P7YQH4_9TREM|nr:unnamed protein product [Schistosoma mattheei]